MLTVPEAVDAITHYRRVHGHSESTIKLDCYVLRALAVPPDEATLADLERVVTRTLTKSTRAMYASRLKSVFAALRDMGVITSTVDVGLPRLTHPSSQPRPLTDDQVRQLLDGMVLPHLDVVRVALLTGARAMEIYAMSGADLAEGRQGPELLLHGKGGKEESVPAHPAVVEIVVGYGTLGRLWPAFSSPIRVSQMVGREMRRVLGEKVEFHQCRHTFGTRVYQATGDIYLTSRLMRHSSVNTTQAYARIADGRPRAAVELLAG